MAANSRFRKGSANPAIARATIAACISAWENRRPPIWKSSGPPAPSRPSRKSKPINSLSSARVRRRYSALPGQAAEARDPVRLPEMRDDSLGRAGFAVAYLRRDQSFDVLARPSSRRPRRDCFHVRGIAQKLNRRQRAVACKTAGQHHHSFGYRVQHPRNEGEVLGDLQVWHGIIHRVTFIGRILHILDPESIAIPLKAETPRTH